MDGLREVGPVASVLAESSFVNDEALVSGGAEESSDEVNREEIMVRDVGSDVFVHVVSGDHDAGDRDDLGENSDVYVDVVGGDDGRDGDGSGRNVDVVVDLVTDDHYGDVDALGGNDDGNIGLRNVGDSRDHLSGGGTESLTEEGIPMVTEERTGEVVVMERVESTVVQTNAETPVVIVTTEVNARKEVEDQGMVDGVIKDVVDQGLVDGVGKEVEDHDLIDKEVLMGLEIVDEGNSVVGHPSHGVVLGDEVWNPGIDSVMLEADGVQQQEGTAMPRESTSSFKHETSGAHETVEAASELSVLDNANHTSAACPLMIETDGAQPQEVAAMVQEKNSRVKDEIPGSDDMVESASELSVPDNANPNSAACLMMLETDRVQQQEGAVSVKDEITGPHEMVEAASELSLPYNANYISAACLLMPETDGEQQHEASVPQDSNSSFKDETPGAHEMEETASELSVPDNANCTSVSCPVMIETDGVQHEVVTEEDVTMFQGNNLTFKGEITGTHETVETASEVMLDNANHASVENLNNSVEVNVRENVEVIYAEERLNSTIAFSESNVADQTLDSFCGDEAINDSPIIEASGSHNNADGGSVSSLHHDAFVNDDAVLDCKISSTDDDNDANFGSHLSVEDSKEVSVLANPVISCKHDLHVMIGSDIGVGTEDDHSGEPLQVIEQEEVLASHVEFDIEPDSKNDNLCTAENNRSMKQEVSCGSDGGQDTARDSTYEQLSDVDRGDWIMMDIDDVLDLKGEAAGLDAPMEDICCAGNTEDFCAVPMTGTNHVNIPAEFNIFESEADAKDSEVLPNCAGDKELHKQVAVGEAEVMADKDDENFIEYSDGNRFQQENENLDALDVGGTAEKEGAMAENTVVQSGEQIITTEACSVKSEEAFSEGEDSFSGKNSQSAHEMPNGSGTVSTVEGSLPVKTEKEDKYAQANQISGHEFQRDDKVSAEEAFGSPNSHVEIGNEVKVAQANQIIGHEAHGDDKEFAEGDYSPIFHVENAAGYSADFVVAGNNDSVFHDGIQNINMSAEVQEPETMETSICDVASSAEVSNQVIEREDEGPKTIVEENLLAVVPESPSVECQPSLGSGEQYNDGELDDSEQPTAMEGDTSEMDQSETLEEGKIQSSSPSSLHQSGYFEPPEADGEFSLSDLVWGKVRSHPWWPGQIFDPSDASDRALKHFKKDSFLLAYFGDRTFAWNDASVLKPFRPHFSQIAKQRNSEALQIAVSGALDEVSRRVKLGLSCSCTPRDVYEKIECQIVENAGIREESSRRYGVDKTTRAALFEPDKLLEHIRALAVAPVDFCDHLELALAKAQLSAFCHFKGYRPPPLFESKEASFEDDTVTFSDKPDCMILDGELLPSISSSSHREKESLKDSLQPKKERSLSELMGDREFSLDEEDGMDGKSISRSIASSGKKRKAVDSTADGSDQRVSIYAAKVSTASSSPRPSFKVGDCIRRVATQLTGAASSLKSNNGQPGSDVFLQSCSPHGNVMLSPKNSTLGDMLSQLQLAARDPKKGYSFLNNIILFFSGFRNSVVSKHVAGRPGGDRKRKTSRAVGSSTEEFEFDDVNDSYWRDKAIQNYHDEHLLQNGDKNDDGYQPIVSPPAKMHKPTRRSYTRKQYSTENYETSIDEPMEEDQSMKQETSPAELIMNFAQGSRIPSQTNLNNMFRRFGPLKEYETEVDQDSCRARVVFKRGTDAEVAYSSSGTFNIFGSMHVTYQLSYLPSSTLRNLPLLISQGQEDAS